MIDGKRKGCTIDFHSPLIMVDKGHLAGWSLDVNENDKFLSVISKDSNDDASQLLSENGFKRTEDG